MGTEVVLIADPASVPSDAVIEWAISGDVKPVLLRAGGRECAFTPANTLPITVTAIVHDYSGASLGDAETTLTPKEYAIEIVVASRDLIALWDATEKASGVVHMNTGKLNLNDIRGYGRGKPLFLFAFSMGALGLTGMPFWSGYVGKTLLHESIVEHIHQLHAPERIGAISELLHSGLFDLEAEVVLFQAVEWIFLLSGALTVEN